MKRILFVLVSATLALSAAFGSTHTWTGGGDGLRFSDKKNWDAQGVPVSGWNTIVLTNAVEGAVISNDLGYIKAYRLKILSGSKSFKLVGDTISLLSNGKKVATYALECKTTDPVEIACNLSIDDGSDYTHYFNCYPGGNLTLSGNIIDSNSYGVYIFVGTGETDTSYQNTDDYRGTIITLSGDNSLLKGGLTLRNATYHFGSPTALGSAGKTVSFNTLYRLHFDAPGTYDYTLMFDDDLQQNFFFNAPVKLPRGIEIKKASKKNAMQIGYVNADVEIGHFGTTALPYTHACFEVADGCTLTVGGLHLTGTYYGITGGSGGETKTGALVLGGTDNTWTTYNVRFSDLFCANANCLNPTGVVAFQSKMNNVYNKAVVNLNGHDQTIDRVSGYSSSYWFEIKNSGYMCERVLTPVGKPATLTMKATANSTIQSDFQGPISLVWDPTDDYTLTINNRTVNMTGDLTVKRGSLVLGSTSSETATMPNVRKCVLGETATLKFATAQTLPVLEVNGSCPAKGRYQPLDGTDETAKKVSWLASGSAVVTANTITTWANAVDGDWSETAKWTGGVPSADIDACITEPGADYAVRIASGAAAIKTLEVANRSGTATLAVSNTLTVAKGNSVTLNAGSRLLFGTGGDGQVKGTVYLNEGASIVAEGGSIAFDIKDSAAGASTENLKQNGGSFLATNDAQISVGGYFSSMFGTGSTRFAGNSKLTGTLCGASVVRLFTTAADSTTGSVEFVEHASLDASKMDQFVIGYHQTAAPTDTVSMFTVDTDGMMDFGSWLMVGYAYGRGELEIANGTVEIGDGGLSVGGWYMHDRSLTDCDVTGVVRMRGGELHNSAYYTTYPVNRVKGFIVGDGWFEKKTDSSANIHRGLFELSDGFVSNRWGNVVLGAGCAEGRMVQTGGTFLSIGADNVHVILGWLGGTGEYILSNGVATVKRPVYVGGLPMANTSYRLDEDHPDGHDATGLLAISGGTFEAKNGVTVGADGAGTIAMGEAGLLDITGNLTLTNGYVEAGSSALVFRPGATTAGTIRASGRLTVAAGSTLTVDCSRLSDDFDFIRLVTCNGMKGAFADENIHLEGGTKAVSKLRLRQRSTGIFLSRQQGTLLIVR